jgi:small nuclear ribonucleoprotein (snRNP)-like protein
VEQLGVGAEARATLKDQQKELRGTVESFDDSVFHIRPGRTGEPKTIRYADVALLEFTQNEYRAEGSPDPATVRRVAVELGIGRKVRVRTQDGNTLVGRIGKLDAEQLNLNVDKSGPMNVSYARVSELRRGGMGGVKRAVVYTAAAAGILVLITVISLTVSPP